MTWLYVPGTFSPAAPASVDLNSVSCSPSDIGERMGAVYVTWRGKPQPPQAWSRRWKQGGFIRLLSGLTCEPSTLDHGVAQFISSLRATPARTTLSLESAPGSMASVSLPPKSPALPKSAGLMLSSARTSRGTRTSNSPPSLHHWKGWATALRQEYSARPRPETPCGASDCSSWPGPDATNRVRDEETLAKCAAFRLRNAGQKTVPLYLAEVAQAWEPQSHWAAPCARDHFPPHTEEYIAAKKAEGHGMRNLTDEAARWSSPKASDPEKAGPNMRGSKGDMPLPSQAVQWPGPQARDHKGVNQVNPLDHNARPLNEVASHFRPQSSPAQPIAGGSMSSTDSPNSNQPSVKRKLNPIFVEALMRWPTGLSGFERQEMAWTRWWHAQLSFLSALYSMPTQGGSEQYDMFGEAA